MRGLLLAGLVALESSCAATDAFGTRMLHRAAPGGPSWQARWEGAPRELHSDQRDPRDPEFAMRGANSTLTIAGGVATVSGEQVRMYVGDPTGRRRWLDLELTVYGMRLGQRADAPPSAGFSFEVRTGDGHTDVRRADASGLPVQCAGKAYAFSFRANGTALIEKELKHPYYTRAVSRQVWDGGPFPENTWVGMKVVVYGVDGGRHVKLELWRDRTDGQDGGRWEKVLEHTDVGGWAIDPDVAATCDIPPDLVITTPAPYVIVRDDGVVEQRLKKLSVREVLP
jgi:hypothetical protein